MPYDLHMVGSVALADAGEVMSTLGRTFGTRLKRYPDGETGRPWSMWMESVFREHPQFTGVAQNVALSDKPGGVALVKYGLRPGVSAGDVRFDNLPVADVAIESYQVFRKLKQQRVLPQGARYQVTIAPGHMAVWRWAEEPLHPVLEPAYDRALAGEIDKMLRVIPRDELAIQWDIASRVFARLEWGKPNRYGATKAEMAATFARELTELGRAVPAGVELLYHFCYGDTGHRHTVEPSSMADMVDMANRVSRAVNRPIELIHMPVPRDREDDGYFEPLRGLRLKPETRIALGLIHLTDGLPGTTRRIAVAHRHLDDFLVSTECGLGRRPPETLAALMKLHAEVAALQRPLH